MFFAIKVQHHIALGSTHLLTLLRLWQQQDPKVQEETKHYIKIEAWWAHPEPVLLTLLTSSDQDDRKFAIQQICKIRGSSDYGSTSVRTFKTPESLNMKAKNCKELIDWDEEVITEPIFAAHMSTSELLSLEEAPLCPPRYSVHTQSCERAVKCVTEAAKQVCGWDRRHRLILSKTEHRKVIPVVKTKKQNMRIFE